MGQGGGYRTVLHVVADPTAERHKGETPPPLGMCGSAGLGCRQLWREPGSQQPTAGPIAKSPSWLSLSSATIKIQDIPARIVNPGSPGRQGRFHSWSGIGDMLCDLAC